MSTEAKPGLNKRVIFADYSLQKFDGVKRELTQEGVRSEGMTDSNRFLARLAEEEFDLCVVNLLIGGIGPFQLIANLKKASKNPELKIIVVSKQVHKLNIQNTIRAGADDFVAEPFDSENLFHRILYHLTPKTVVEDLRPTDSEVTAEKNTRYLTLVLEAVELLSQTERSQIHGSFLKVLQRTAEMLQSNRTSLIIVDKKTSSGVVLASSDDANFYDFPITLTKYPEILHVVNSGNIVLVEDVSRNWLTYKIRDKVRSIEVGSIMVFPVRYQSEVVGVLSIRRPKATEMPSMEVLSILQALANILAAHSNLKILLRKIYSDFAENG